MIGAPFAFVTSFEQVGKFLVSALAVAGAAFLGGLLVSLLSQLLARMLTAKAIPRPALNFLRILGGLAAGVLVWMVLFRSAGGGGGWGWGGDGFGLGGPGKGNGGEPVRHDKDDKDKDARPDKTAPKNGEPASKKNAVRIEVIVDPKAPPERSYRLEGDKDLRTREEISQVLEQRRKDNPDLKKVVIVLYKNSPDRHTSVVRELVELVERKGFPSPDISLEASRAP